MNSQALLLFGADYACSLLKRPTTWREANKKQFMALLGNRTRTMPSTTLRCNRSLRHHPASRLVRCNRNTSAVASDFLQKSIIILVVLVGGGRCRNICCWSTAPPPAPLSVLGWVTRTMRHWVTSANTTKLCETAESVENGSHFKLLLACAVASTKFDATLTSQQIMLPIIAVHVALNPQWPDRSSPSP